MKRGKNPLSSQNLYFINQFIVSGGFQKILNLIDWAHFERFSQFDLSFKKFASSPEKEIKKAGNFKSDNSLNFPFLFIRETFLLFKIIFPNLISPKKEAFAKDLVTVSIEYNRYN